MVIFEKPKLRLVTTIREKEWVSLSRNSPRGKVLNNITEPLNNCHLIVEFPKTGIQILRVPCDQKLFLWPLNRMAMVGITVLAGFTGILGGCFLLSLALNGAIHQALGPLGLPLVVGGVRFFYNYLKHREVRL